MLNVFTSPPVLAGLAILGASIFVSCRAGAKREPVVLHVQTVSRGVSSGMAEEACVAIRSAEEFDALWQRHGNLQLPSPKAPEVDFGACMVVGVFLGTRATAGFGVEIQSVEQIPASGKDGSPTLLIRARETTPEEGSVVAQMVTAPFHVVRVDRAEGDPVLELTR